MDNLKIENQIQISDKIVNLENLKTITIHPTVTDNILDLTDITEDVVIDHHINQLDPTDLLVISKNIQPVNITIYFRAIFENKSGSRKVYNKCPFITNTTNADIVLMGYSIDFIINDNIIKTSLLCNNVSAIHDSSFTVKTTMYGNSVDKLSEIHEVSMNEIKIANENHSDKINHIRDGILDIIKLRSDSDSRLSAFIDLLENRKNIDQSLLKKNKKYKIIQFNGLLTGVCTEGFFNSSVKIKCNVKFGGKYLNGVIGGYVSIIRDSAVLIDGNIIVTDDDKSFFSGICAGISRWVSNVRVVVSGNVGVSGKVSGIIVGSASAVFNIIDCKINEKILLRNEERFGIIMGYLSPIPSSISTIDNNDNNFRFKMRFKVGDLYLCAIKSETSGKEYDIIGQKEKNIKLPDDNHEEETNKQIQTSDKSTRIEIPNPHIVSSDKIREKLIPETKQTNTINKRDSETYDRHNASWDTFDLIKRTRKIAGLTAPNFPSTKNKEIKVSKVSKANKRN